MNRHNKGFTLMEMLIVVAIITILISVSIPVLGYQLERSRRATCLENQESMKSLLMANYFTFRDKYKVKTLYYNCIEGNNKQDYTCPSGGNIYYYLNADTGVATMSCTIHNPRGADRVLETAAANIGKELFKEGGGYVNSVDSNATGGANKTDKVKNWLSQNVVLFEYDKADTWKIARYDDNNVRYIWSGIDISIERDNAGTVINDNGSVYKNKYIPAILYDGTNYYVGMTKVELHEQMDNGGVGEYYYIARNAISEPVASNVLTYPSAQPVNKRTFTTREEAEAYYYSELDGVLMPGQTTIVTNR